MSVEQDYQTVLNEFGMSRTNYDTDQVIATITSEVEESVAQTFKDDLLDIVTDEESKKLIADYLLKYYKV